MTVHQRFRRRFSIWLLAAVLLGTPALSSAQDKTDDASPNTGDASPAIDPVEVYRQARIAFNNETEAYWQSIADKRGARIAKRRKGEQIVRPARIRIRRRTRCRAAAFQRVEQCLRAVGRGEQRIMDLQVICFEQVEPGAHAWIERAEAGKIHAVLDPVVPVEVRDGREAAERRSPSEE